jgi:hypothetical protein
MLGGMNHVHLNLIFKQTVEELPAPGPPAIPVEEVLALVSKIEGDCAAIRKLMG